MSTEKASSLSIASIVEDVLKNRLSDLDSASRKAEEAALRRYEAARWLRKMVGVVGGKDLPAQPSEEEFRLGLRRGIILCNVLNKVQPGAVPKVVESSSDSVTAADGAALSAFQYFENVRNFLVPIEEMGLPTFQASDLAQGEKSSRIVDCVLALKAYNDWKQAGGTGFFKLSPNIVRPPTPGSGKHFARKTSDPFMGSIVRSFSMVERSVDSLFIEQTDISEAFSEGSTRSVNMLVRAALSDKKPEEIPAIVESMLSKILEEFEHRLESVNGTVRTTPKDVAENVSGNSFARSMSCDDKTGSEAPNEKTMDVESLIHMEAECCKQKCTSDEEPENQISMIEQQQSDELLKQQAQINHQQDEVSELQAMNEQQQNDQLLKQKRVLEQQQSELLKQKTVLEQQQNNELLKQKRVLEQQQNEGLLKQKTVLEQQQNEELLKQKTVLELQQNDELLKQKRVLEQQQSELLKQKAALEQHQRSKLLKQQRVIEQQKRDVQELKNMLHATKAGMQLMQTKYVEEFSNLGKHLYGLAHAASGYRKVLDENRKLYNLVQDLKGNIRVYCRVRPFLGPQQNCPTTVGHIEEGNITIKTPSKSGKEGQKSFNFNKSFGPSSTQEEVFSDMQPLVRSALDGYNVCIFAYGQTGSGKTYTMTGPKVLTEESLGVNYRALADLFLLSDQRKNTINYDISVQMLEIYNEQVRDLLATDGSSKRLEIRNSTQNGINVPDANIVPVSTTSDVINLMNIGHKNRAVGSTAMNDRSSRSHSCLTVHVQGRELTSGNIIRGSMHLVDLAGSERLDKTDATGDRLKEAQHINKSLSALGDVIASLAQKGSHVPYRNSKLTQLLQDSLGGQAKTLMFIHISPEHEALGETLSTLKFAERVATIELGAAKVNKDTGDVKELKEKITSLKAALARKDGERDSVRSSQSGSPEKTRTKRGGASPSIPKWQSLGDIYGTSQRQVEDVNMENDSSSTPRRQSFDLHDLLTSPSWPAMSSPALSGKEDDRDSVSSDNADKGIVKKHDVRSRDDSSLENWEESSLQSSEKSRNNYNLDTTKMEQNSNKGGGNAKDNNENDAQRNKYEIASTDDSDVEAGGSDCSEADMAYQSNLPKTNISNGSGSRASRHQPKPAKKIETRSSIPSVIPSPSPSPSAKRRPNGGSSHLQKPGRTNATDGRRKTGHAK